MSGFHSFLHLSIFKDLALHIFIYLGTNTQNHILHQSLMLQLLLGNFLTIVQTLGQGVEI